MILFKRFILIISFLFLSFVHVYGSEKISFLDMEFIIKNSNVGKSLLQKIDNLNNENIKKLTLRENELKKLEETIKKKENILSKEELDKEINKLRNNIKKFRIEKDSMVKNLNKTKKKELSKLYEKINPIIQTYMDENDIQIIIDVKNIIVGKSDSNITIDIMDEINKNIN